MSRDRLPDVISTVNIASFVTWLATCIDDDATLGQLCEAVEAYLDFVAHDHGPPGSRGARFVSIYRAQLPPVVSRAALAWFAEYRQSVGQPLNSNR